MPAANSNPCHQQVYGLFMDEQIRACWGLQREWLRQAGEDLGVWAIAIEQPAGACGDAFQARWTFMGQKASANPADNEGAS